MKKLFLKVKGFIKKMCCNHVYRYDRFALDGYTKYHIYECRKCNKIKSKNMGK